MVAIWLLGLSWCRCEWHRRTQCSAIALWPDDGSCVASSSSSFTFAMQFAHTTHSSDPGAVIFLYFPFCPVSVCIVAFLACALSLQLNTIAAAQRKQWKWIAYAALPKPKRKRKNHICAHYCHGSIAVFVHKFALAGHTNAQHHRATIEIYAESFFFSFFIWSVFESVLVNRSDLPPVRLFFSVLFISRTRLRLNFSQCQTVN